MDLRQEEFQRFAEHQLNTSSFKTDANDDSSHIFHTSLESAVQRFAWTENARNIAGDPFRLNAGFIDIFSPNAFADRDGDTHVIAMHTALFVAIGEFALFCFAQQDFFSELGDPSKEVSPKPWNDQVPGLWLIDHTSKGKHVRNEHSRSLIPKDPERYICSQYLQFLMARFVWLHELAHCFNGHVDYARHHKLALRLHELPVAISLAQKRSVHTRHADAAVLQGFEFDADKSALWGGLQIQLGKLENIEGISALPQATRLKLTLFGSYAMTWLFEQFQLYMETGESLSHPSPLVRLRALFQTVQDSLLSQHPDLETLNNEAISQFDNVRSRIPSLYVSNDLIGMFEKPESSLNTDESAKQHAELLKDLEQFQYSEV